MRFPQPSFVLCRGIPKSPQNKDMDDPDAYYKVRADSTDVTASRFHPKVGKTLTEKKWRAAFDKQGRLDISRVLIRIQGGGVHPSIRGEVWEFLLGVFAADSTYSDREALRRSHRETYFQYKAECQGFDSAVGSGVVVTLPRINENGNVMGDTHLPHLQAGGIGEGSSVMHDSNKADGLPRSLLSLIRQDNLWTDDSASKRTQEPIEGHIKQLKGPQLHRSTPIKAAGQNSHSQDSQSLGSGEPSKEKKVTQWRLTLHQIGLDVVRTDRTLEFYENTSNLAKLWDILAVYSWIDPDIGYCQGMSDLCSPMVLLLQNEADAFWCFERLMYRLRENFRCTEQAVGVQKQLANLGLVLQVIDPKLYKHLDELGGGSFIFAFRMLMVLFRREFSFADSLYLWEIMWALEYDPDLGVRHHSGFQQQEQKHQQHSIYMSKPFAGPGSGWIVRKGKALYKWGKFERQIIKYGHGDSHEIPFVVFCAASIFESQRARLQEAPGLDEVVKLLNEVTGKLDAKRACKEALKIHKKYLLKGAKLA